MTNRDVHSIKFSFFCNKYLVIYSNYLNFVYYELEIAFFWKENKYRKT